MILKPLINEKSMRLVQEGFYTFEVSRNANKDSISKLVEDKFGVKVIDAKVINIQPKKKMQRARRLSFLSGGSKKMLLRLKKGQKLAIFEAPVEEEVTVTTAEGEKVANIKEKKGLFGGPKVKIEKEQKEQSVSKEQIVRETEKRVEGKESHVEKKKGK